MTRLIPYLLFDGVCAEAMMFYRSCLGGEIVMTTVGESPLSSGFPPELHGAILHAELRADAIQIAASDWLHPTRRPQRGNTSCLCLLGRDRAEIEAWFEALAAAACETDIEPIGDMPFGAYGALTDRFGVRWMFRSSGA